MTAFIDSNVLIYAEDDDEPARQRVARALLERLVHDRAGTLSTQVLQEFYVNAVRKLGIDAAVAKGRIVHYTSMPVVTITTDLVLSAIDLCRLDAISFWDALVVTCADHAGCDVLYSEDLQHGRRFGSVRVVNPFV